LTGGGKGDSSLEKIFKKLKDEGEKERKKRLLGLEEVSCWESGGLA